MDASAEKICKTVCQHNELPVPAEDMKKLLEIAEDYRTVKNYVYSRYGGKGGLAKIYPGYTVQNEMTKSGLRSELAMPSVYFYLAIFDALGDIKSQWTRTKTRVLKLIGQNDRFSEEEKHYLRFLLKTSNAFEAVLNQREIHLPQELQKRYAELVKHVDSEKLHRYLCRQVRKYHVGKLHTDAATGFSVTERAYRYADHGLYISTKESRKRIFILLTDNNSYKSQLYIQLFPDSGNIEIKVPVNVTVRSHIDYTETVGLAIGMYTMLTTNKGHIYGEQMGSLQTEYAAWVREQTASYNRNRNANPGRKKYQARKKRYVEQLHSYVNRELNRFLATEKPRIIYMVKMPGAQGGGINRKINNSVTLWQRGYIRRRLLQKCREQSVEVIDVLGRGISSECSYCGMQGEKKNGIFTCLTCGQSLGEKTNTARNVLRRGTEGKILH
ncbi:MAG TPA: hypothetical protein DDY31_16475 [Lachnospiraceae bacterium]|nr:hypothetical protein [Lachnospiraceae bacterium]